MTETNRKKVSILEICSAKIAELDLKIKTVENSKIEAEGNLQALDKKLIAEIKSLKNELLKTEALIKEVIKEGVDSQKLDQKSKDITSKISLIEAARINSLEIENTKKVFSEIEIEIKKLEILKAEWGAKQKLAEKLKNSHELNRDTGAVSVLEFETLQDAVNEYLDNIPVIISISEDMTINRVALWHYADQTDPLEFDLFASKKGDRFLYNKLPRQLSWLSNFKNSTYGKMRFDDAQIFNSNGVTFVINSQSSSNASENKDDTASKKWYGENMRTFYSDYRENSLLKIPKDSIFSPEGFKWSSRSGFCYIKSEEKFYSFLNNSFLCSELATRQVSKNIRPGYNQIVNEE
ncbi:MAG: hypothetical protein EBU93_07505, partial [Chlamydiae bacterium]|nr:hypothetical protein [Chlamydiota bacterium]